eukprot:501811-Pleurochrysis_carterae.AAC.1
MGSSANISFELANRTKRNCVVRAERETDSKRKRWTVQGLNGQARPRRCQGFDSMQMCWKEKHEMAKRQNGLSSIP